MGDFIPLVQIFLISYGENISQSDPAIPQSQGQNPWGRVCVCASVCLAGCWREKKREKETVEGENERGRDDRRDVVKLATLSEQFALGFKGNVISVADSGKSPLLSIILPAGGLWLSPSLFPLSAVANSLMTNCSSFSWSWTKWHSDSRRKSHKVTCMRAYERKLAWMMPWFVSGYLGLHNVHNL